jgi:RNA polymerase sigma-70 factor (ECF subfamily)
VTRDPRERFEAIAADVYEPLQRYLRRRAAPDDADDALGDVLLTVWRRLDAVPADAVLPWCYGVARRVLANQRRSARRRRHLIERLTATRVPPPAPDPLESEIDPSLARAFGRLGPVDREVLAMWAWEQMEPREIAVALGISPNAAALRLSRARRRLADAVGQDSAPSGHQANEHTEERHG